MCLELAQTKSMLNKDRYIMTISKMSLNYLTKAKDNSYLLSVYLVECMLFSILHLCSQSRYLGSHLIPPGLSVSIYKVGVILILTL